MIHLKNMILSGLWITLIGISIGSPCSSLEAFNSKGLPRQTHHVDHYVKNLITTRIDVFGNRYQIISDRILHKSVENTLLFNHPHILQHLRGSATLRHIYSDCGWIDHNRSIISLIGNVTMIEDMDSHDFFPSNRKQNKSKN